MTTTPASSATPASPAAPASPPAPAAPSHGLDPSPAITSADARGPFAPASPAQAQPTNDPTQGGRTEPIGGADGGQASVYKPQGGFDHLIGQTDKETIDKYHQAYAGARAELAKGRPEIPAPDKYQFNWSDKVKGAGGIAADDQAVRAFAEIAHKHGFSQEQVGAIPAFLDMAIDKGWIDKPFDSAAHLDGLAPANFRGTPEERQAKGAERLAAAETWIRQLDPKTQGFDDAMKTELRLLTTTAGGIKVIEKLMHGAMNPTATAGSGMAPAAITKADLDARVADPRNDSQGAKFDPAYAAETRQMFKAMYGD